MSGEFERDSVSTTGSAAFRPLRLIAVAVAIATVTVGCGGTDRPPLDDWLTSWESAHQVSTSIGSDVTELSAPDCKKLLTTGKDSRSVLLPSPNESIDVVDNWLLLAESIGFDCNKRPDLSAAMKELRDLESQIDAGVEKIQPTK